MANRSKESVSKQERSLSSPRGSSSTHETLYSVSSLGSCPPNSCPHRRHWLRCGSSAVRGSRSATDQAKGMAYQLIDHLETHTGAQRDAVGGGDGFAGDLLLARQLGGGGARTQRTRRLRGGGGRGGGLHARGGGSSGGGGGGGGGDAVGGVCVACVASPSALRWNLNTTKQPVSVYVSSFLPPVVRSPRRRTWDMSLVDGGWRSGVYGETSKKCPPPCRYPRSS